jgi:hypothetical protein
VDTAGEIEKRVTAAPVILTSPAAFGRRKQQENGELYLLVDGPGWAIKTRLRPNQVAQARAFATRINAASGAEPVDHQ